MDCVSYCHGQTYYRNSVPDWDALANVYNGFLQRLDSRVELHDLGNDIINMSTMTIAPKLCTRLATPIRASGGGLQEEELRMELHLARERTGYKPVCSDHTIVETLLLGLYHHLEAV